MHTQKKLTHSTQIATYTKSSDKYKQTDGHTDTGTDTCTDPHTHTKTHRKQEESITAMALFPPAHGTPAPRPLPAAPNSCVRNIGPARRFDWPTPLQWFYFSKCGFEATWGVMRGNNSVHCWTTKVHRGNVDNRCEWGERISTRVHARVSLQRWGIQIGILIFIFLFLFFLREGSRRRAGTHSGAVLSWTAPWSME